jgi:hypothetical protein
MAEDDKNRMGPQKVVPSVFKGVPLPQNNGAGHPSGTTGPGHTPGVPARPEPQNKQIPKSSLVTKLSQSEDSSRGPGQNRAAGVFPKTAPKKQAPQSPLINRLPQPQESLKQPGPVVQPEAGRFSESARTGLWQQIMDKLFAPKPGVSPARQKAMVIMVPILAIIMIFAFRQVLSNAPSQTEGAGTDDAPVVAKADTGTEIDWKIPEPIQITEKDPAKLPDESDNQNQQQNQETAEPDNATGTIIIRDIVFSRDKPSAVIGSKIVYVGDVINGATIVKIDRDGVEFEKNGDRWEQMVREVNKFPILKTADQNEEQSESTKIK